MESTWKTWIRSLSCLALVLTSVDASAAARMEHAVIKVLKDHSPAAGGQELELEAMRNEWVGFQVVVSAPTEALTGLDLVLGELDGPEGARLSPATAERYLEYYVDLDFTSPCDLWHPGACDVYDVYDRPQGAYPDALIPFVDPYDPEHPPVAAPFDVAKGDLTTVYVDWFVPAEAAPGLYSGELELRAGDLVLETLALRVEVWDILLPETRSMGTSFGFSHKLLWYYHGGPEAPGDPYHPADDKRARIVKNYELAVHAHRIDFRAQAHGLDYDDFSFNEDGSVAEVDIAGFEAFLEPRLDGSYYAGSGPGTGGGGALNRFDLTRFCPGRGTGALSDEQYSRASAWLADWLEEKGWLDQVFLYSTDEPWLPGHEGATERIAEDAIKLRAYTDKWDKNVLVTGPRVEELAPHVDIWCPVTPMYGDSFWPEGMRAGPEVYEAHRGEGGELWFYVCNANFPPQMGYDVDSPLGWEPRLLKWGAWMEGATGFLFWRINYWQSEDPWQVLVNLPQFGEHFSRNGDGILIYPGDHDGKLAGIGSPEGIALDGPILSYRLKQVRDGMEDWELLILADEAGIGDYARGQVATVYRAFGQVIDADFDIEDPPWTLDPQALMQARRNIAAKLQYALNPVLYPDPEQPPVPDEHDAAEPVVEVLGEDIGGSDSQAPEVTQAEADEDSAEGSGCAWSTGARPPRTPGALGLTMLGLSLAFLARRRSRRKGHELS